MNSKTEEREIIIGFSRPRGCCKVFSWLIRLFEGGSPYSHVYVKSWSRNTYQWLIYQASGVQVNFIGEKYFLEKAEVCAEFKFNISENALREYHHFAIRYAGAPYGLKAVLGIGLMRLFRLRKNPWADGDKSFYCAEIVARALDDFIRRDLISPETFESAGPKAIYRVCEKLIGGENVK